MVSRIVIVGAGLAGASAAAQLRERDYDGAVTLLSAQRHQPYELPPLSKGILLGEADEPDWVREPSFYRDFDIDLRTGTDVTRLLTEEHTVLDAAGGSYAYDAAVLATGSRPKTLAVPGIELSGLHTLRTLEDALALRETFTEGARLVVIGAGWIGCEVAAAARKHGTAVTVVEQGPAPLLGVLGDEIAEVFTRLHTENGVEFRFGRSVQGFTGDAAVRSVRLDDGSELPADVVVLAVGAQPRIELAEAAGIQIAGGAVAVDSALRTSVPEIYAIGDIAAHDHPRYGTRVRVEHWSNAKDQGIHAASAILGEAGDYTAAPYFFTDQYELGCEYRGLADPGKDELVVRGSLADREFIAFWLREGAVRAAMNVNLWDDGDALQALVDNGTEVSADALCEGELGELAG
ncbi:NAD(P)/FAD-dependent oxidoreductase [Sciscionella marina]|uniref:NAD(P)/FAD-dependent oxidoreductase n=1 Tax=Sciscionella marina TaxID=508770 RepID=UPI00036A312D|nr:FAD-dependent oxidoreductase [Sciscionella marina]